MSVLKQLQSFAHEHGLPHAETAEGPDGHHAFLYSVDKARRYAYLLTWDEQLPHLLWVMLNPGTGETESRRRNTFERCKRWSTAMGYGGLLFGNVFSLRSKSAKELSKFPNMPDDLNEQALRFLSGLATETIVAWGNHGAKSDRSVTLHGLLSNPKCFGLTKSGQPRHPLYVPGDAKLIPWTGLGTLTGEANQQSAQRSIISRAR